MPRGREGDQATDDGSGLDQMTLITSVKRTLISISHATPEANDFTLWLGARLAPRPRHRNRSDSTVQSDWIPRAPGVTRAVSPMRSSRISWVWSERGSR